MTAKPQEEAEPRHSRRSKRRRVRPAIRQSGRAKSAGQKGPSRPATAIEKWAADALILSRRIE
jgi:hypothetical protein